jgi:hypothetical protein
VIFAEVRDERAARAAARVAGFGSLAAPGRLTLGSRFLAAERFAGIRVAFGRAPLFFFMPVPID